MRRMCWRSDVAHANDAARGHAVSSCQRRGPPTRQHERILPLRGARGDLGVQRVIGPAAHGMREKQRKGIEAQLARDRHGEGKARGCTADRARYRPEPRDRRTDKRRAIMAFGPQDEAILRLGAEARGRRGGSTNSDGSPTWRAPALRVFWHPVDPLFLFIGFAVAATNAVSKRG